MLMGSFWLGAGNKVMKCLKTWICAVFCTVFRFLLAWKWVCFSVFVFSETTSIADLSFTNHVPSGCNLTGLPLFTPAGCVCARAVCVWLPDTRCYVRCCRGHRYWRRGGESAHRHGRRRMSLSPSWGHLWTLPNSRWPKPNGTGIKSKGKPH